MDAHDGLTVKAQLAKMVDNMDEWQAQLVLSFVKTLFGPEPTVSKEHPDKCENQSMVLEAMA